MGNGLFGDLAGKVAAALAGRFLPATLVRVTPGMRGSDALAGTNSSSRRYACRGIVGSYGQSQIDGTLVAVDDRRITLLGNTIAGGSVVPQPSDCVIIEDTEYLIVSVARDADRSAYVCQSRVKG